MAFTAAEGVVDLTLGGLGGFNAGMSGVVGTLDGVGRRLEGVSRIARNLFIGLGGAIGVTTALAGQQELAEAKMAAAIRATGGAAGFTAAQILKQAEALQAVTTFGDEAILGAQSILLTFKEIKGDEFKEVTERVLDLASLMGSGATEGAKQLGKALNDPIRGVSALAEAGIQFTDGQREQIKNFIETNRLADAQRVILNEVKGQLGGLARAAADTPTGKILQMKNALSDVAQELGKVFLPVLGQIAKKITEIIPRVKAWIDDNRELIGSVAAVTLGLTLAIAVIAKLAAVLVAGAAAFFIFTAAGGTLAGLGAVILAVGATFAVGLAAILGLLAGFSIGEALDAKFDLSGLIVLSDIGLKGMWKTFKNGLELVGKLFVFFGKKLFDLWKLQFTLLADITMAGLKGIIEAIKTRSTTPLKDAMANIGKISSDAFNDAIDFTGALDSIDEFDRKQRVIKEGTAKELAAAKKSLAEQKEQGEKDGEGFGKGLSDALAKGLLKGQDLWDALKEKFPKLELPEITIPDFSTIPTAAPLKSAGAADGLGLNVEANLRPSFTSLEGAFTGLQTAGTKRERVAEQQLAVEEKQLAAMNRVEHAVRENLPRDILI